MLAHERQDPALLARRQLLQALAVIPVLAMWSKEYLVGQLR
jgi:hypothetical protein